MAQPLSVWQLCRRRASQRPYHRHSGLRRKPRPQPPEQKRYLRIRFQGQFRESDLRPALSLVWH